MEHLPVPIQTAYHELMQRFRARPPLSVLGSIMRIEKSGRGYWVSRRRIGDRVVEKTIGPETPEVLATVAAARAEREVYDGWRKKNATLVSMLRAAGLLSLDVNTGKVLSSLSRVGFFEIGGILGGTNAFRLYPALLGVAAPAREMVFTGDVGMLAPSHIRLVGPREPLTSRLLSAGLEFETRFPMGPADPSKHVVQDNIEIEILGPVARGGETSYFHEGIQEPVAALRLLEFSLRDPVRVVALYREGVEVTVPAPERFALHKLIVAQLRTGCFKSKRNKDLRQASWLLKVLAEARPKETMNALRDIRSRGPTWRKHLSASLREAPDAAKALRWIEAETDDPDPGWYDL